ncbi:MAG: hypothetical protein EA421_01810 [Gemmatimonadales bacterium]|nr:MAG: hypothetical protein EA421_01810 [Gemmatimonadales bacterium]
MVFMERNRRADDYPWLQWKVRLFAIGAGLALGGVILDWGWLIPAAIIVLVAGFALRFLPGGTGVREEDPEEEEEENAM